jgi:hypothetical protein
MHEDMMTCFTCIVELFQSFYIFSLSFIRKNLCCDYQGTVNDRTGENENGSQTKSTVVNRMEVVHQSISDPANDSSGVFPLPLQKPSLRINTKPAGWAWARSFRSYHHRTGAVLPSPSSSSGSNTKHYYSLVEMILPSTQEFSVQYYCTDIYHDQLEGVIEGSKSDNQYLKPEIDEENNDQSKEDDPQNKLVDLNVQIKPSNNLSQSQNYPMFIDSVPSTEEGEWISHPS